MEDAKLTSAAALRNRGPILDVLRSILPREGRVLEIASGTGEHVVHFAADFPGLDFQPSDIAPDRRASIDAHARGHANIRPAIALDTTTDWTSGLPAGGFAALICVNMIHIAPWAACEGLIAGAARLLAPGGRLVLYGPYLRAGTPTAPGNLEFDADLRRRNPAWGLRDLDAVTQLAHRQNLGGPDIVEMPANNLCVLFRMGAGDATSHLRAAVDHAGS
jgi:SAM-dependent methyltransferase